MPELDFEQDVLIDEMALDVEWLNQASKALKYGKLVSALRYKVNRLEEKKKTVRSELIIEANKNPEGCCNKKSPNANDIEAYYRAHPKYREVVDAYLAAQSELEYAEVARSEVTFTRRAALENLVRLHAANYFAGPQSPRDLSREVQGRYKQAEAPVRINRKLDTPGTGT